LPVCHVTGEIVGFREPLLPPVLFTTTALLSCLFPCRDVTDTTGDSVVPAHLSSLHKEWVRAREDEVGGPAGCSRRRARGQAAAACRQMLAASSWPPLSPLRRGGWIGKRVGSCSHCRFLGQKEIGGSSANARAPCACSGQNHGRGRREVRRSWRQANQCSLYPPCAASHMRSIAQPCTARHMDKQRLGNLHLYDDFRLACCSAQLPRFKVSAGIVGTNE